MNKLNVVTSLAIVGSTLLTVVPSPAADAPPKIPRFSVDYMDTTIDPGTDFYHY
ncbi:MAG: hypothetical protein JWQ04_2463, partial [Pedosphaera sp.]|nr:hypothetical protein [Pedosphaera sp.]